MKYLKWMSYLLLLKRTRRDRETGGFTRPYTRIWTAVDRNRFKTTAFKIGDVNKSNFIELALEIEKECGSIEYLCTDESPSYGYYKLANKHIASKSETCFVEIFNSSMRDMLARLNRRTKRFSKCIERLRLTLVMFFNKQIVYYVYL